MILIATDKFKGSLTSKQCSAIIEEAYKVYNRSAVTVRLPVSDGGDGFIESLSAALKDCSVIHFETTAANGRPVFAPVLIDRQNKRAFIESATVCGLVQIPQAERNPLTLTSHGLGVLLEKTLKLPDSDVEEIYTGIGGTAVTDGGFGLLTALGAGVFDKEGRLSRSPSVHRDVAHKLSELDTIGKLDAGALKAKIRKKLFVLTDVENPLTGPEGAVYTYAKQKGAKDDQLPVLEERLRRLAGAVRSDYKVSPAARGTGAGGGIPFALLHLGAKILPGSSAVLDAVRFDEYAEQAGLIITGEGRFDHTSLKGKITGEILKRSHCRVILFCGISEIDPETYKDIHPDLHVTETINRTEPLSENIKKAALYLKEAALKTFQSTVTRS